MIDLQSILIDVFGLSVMGAIVSLVWRKAAEEDRQEMERRSWRERARRGKR